MYVRDTEPRVLMACNQTLRSRHGHTVSRKIDLWVIFHLYLVEMTFPEVEVDLMKALGQVLQSKNVEYGQNGH